jgi:RNA polymerase sigma factor (sigma-70 family)
MDSRSTVFLVDDDASVRKALTRLIKSAGHEVRSFASAREFLEKSEISQDAGRAACLILDVRMPELSGLDLQKELKKLEAPFPIIFITGHGDIPMTVRAMKAGAVDFLSKPVKAQVLLQAIDQALARARKENAERAGLDEIKRRLDNLTPREREVMQLVVKGYLNKQIAFELGTVEKTVKVHRARVMEKMKARSLADLVRLAERASATIGKHSAGAENSE